MRQRLKEARTEAGLTQAELAERIKVSRQAVIALETDKHSPSLDLAFRIAAVFGTEVEAIFENPYRQA
jgi:putative transcriptional regulator